MLAAIVLSTTFAGTTHRVSSGDTLSAIAVRYGTTVAALVDANGIRNPNHIVVGSTLDVPGSTGVSTPTTTTTTYRVRVGDTLSSIAVAHGTTVAAIVELNGIRNPNLIIAGRSLKISGTSSITGGGGPSTAPTGGGGTQLPGKRHKVQYGESLASIAAHYGISKTDLARWNGITDGRLYATASLLLFDPGPLPQLTGGTETSTHTVAAGESLGSIASRYGSTVAKIAAANGIKNPNLIRVGQRLTIPGGGGAASVRCPIPGATFFNDWGFPRSGGRTHEGNDLFAARGTPVRAPNAGAVTQTSNPLSGLAVRVTDAHGGYWFIGHLDAFGASGQVAPGDIIGYVGDSGNAKGSRPHAHIEYRNSSRVALNPYPILRQVC